MDSTLGTRADVLASGLKMPPQPPRRPKEAPESHPRGPQETSKKPLSNPQKPSRCPKRPLPASRPPPPPRPSLFPASLSNLSLGVGGLA
eukprot:1799582-Pyramimonas_sp.AAC.1